MSQYAAWEVAIGEASYDNSPDSLYIRIANDPNENNGKTLWCARIGGISKDQDHTLDVSLNEWKTIYLDKNIIKVDNASISISNASYSTQPSKTMYLFAANYAGNPWSDRLFKGKIRSVKIYNGENLLTDFIPVRVGQVGYLYDKVSGELFGNQGSGNFTLGPDKVNSSSFRYVRMNITKIRGGEA